MNEGNEMGTETRVETEEVEAYKEPEVEEEGGVEMETEPPRGRTKAAAAYMGRGSRTVSLKWDDEVSAVDETALSGKDKQGWILTVFKSKDGASAVDETALSGKDKQGWILTVFKSKDGASAVDETAPAVEQTEQAAPAVDETPADVDETPAAVEQTEQGASAKETNEPATDKGAEGAENDPKPRGRPRKSTDPKKFTTPKQRTRTRSQWISSPYTEADTNEIEGRKKKKPRTEA
ncbi:hypothetical protein Bca52824_083034 [Brassica carinata]|uniref:Uncharacterized protein n=1 Tax=Brassica carinata TaxID=52824 RepID=A0A8X7PL92_BRACI|nr:hypothetical protein Bca52824_083034 [Brassica carinata]